MACFEKKKDKVFTSKDVAKKCKIEAKKAGRILSKLVKEGELVRVSKGRYQYPAEIKALSREQKARYLATMEKTCEITIHELMLTEPYVGQEDKNEIEHQIAYFARRLVRARWALEKEELDAVEMEEEVFKRAKKIHAWSKYVFKHALPKK